MSVGNGSSIESEKYHIIRELGRGGMGVVYLAEDRQLRRQVALKVLYEYLNRDRAFVERFQEEACSVSTLHHPNIVCVHGLERAGEVVAIDMELVEGVSLDHLASASPHVGAAIARDVLGGLAACHQIGVVHRDIKPSNILLNQSGQAKITDFGLATAYASHMETTLQGGSSSGFYMGTPRYMPMQAWEGGSPEPVWDLYSFGVVLHELISGKPAFKGDNPVAVMRKQLTEPLPPLHTVSPHVSAQFSQLVEALMNSCREGNGLTCADAFDLLRASPEFKALQESDTASTLPMKTLVKRRRKKPQGRARVSRSILLVSALILVAILVGLIYPLLPSFPSQPASRNPHPVPVSGVAFYDAWTVQAPPEDNLDLMVEVDKSRKPQRITALSSLSLWSLEVGEGEQGKPLPVKGNWARRLSSEGGAFERGTVEGTIQWDLQSDQPLLVLERRRGNDHNVTRWVLLGKRKAQEFGRSEFLRGLESNSAVMTLLYRELIPRGLPWAESIEASLPGGPGGRTSVPKISDEVLIDGFLNEPTWREPIYDDTGRIGELNTQGQKSGQRMLVRWDSTAVYLAFDVQDLGESGMEIAIAPKTELEPRYAGRYVVTIDPAGNLEGTYYLGTTPQAWVIDWKVAIQTKGKTSTVEIEIPTATFATEALPVERKRWRINARVVPPSSAGSNREYPVWGESDVSLLEHGAILVFK